MELVAGGSLQDRLEALGPLEPREAAALVDRVARAVDYAHAEGVLHRDLKPANVLLTPEGAPLVTDFGLAVDVERRSRLTEEGTVLGTAAYMPPEQAAGELDRVGPRSDVWASGPTRPRRGRTRASARS